MTREDAKNLFRKDKDSYGKPKSIMHKIDQIFDDFDKEKRELIVKLGMLDDIKLEENVNYPNMERDGWMTDMNHLPD